MHLFGGQHIIDVWRSQYKFMWRLQYNQPIWPPLYNLCSGRHMNLYGGRRIVALCGRCHIKGRISCYVSIRYQSASIYFAQLGNYWYSAIYGRVSVYIVCNRLNMKLKIIVYNMCCSSGCSRFEKQDDAAALIYLTLRVIFGSPGIKGCVLGIRQGPPTDYKWCDVYIPLTPQIVNGSRISIAGDKVHVKPEQKQKCLPKKSDKKL